MDLNEDVGEAVLETDIVEDTLLEPLAVENREREANDKVGVGDRVFNLPSLGEDDGVELDRSEAE